MIDEFTIGIILLLILFGSVFLFLIFSITAPAFGDDSEDDVGLCYTYHYDPACMRMFNQYCLEKFNNSRMDWLCY